MKTFRIRFAVKGDHVRCRLFVGPTIVVHTIELHALCGEFAIRRGEEFKLLLEAFSGADFIGDDEGVGIVEATTET